MLYIYSDNHKKVKYTVKPTFRNSSPSTMAHWHALGIFIATITIIVSMVALIFYT